MADFNFYFHFKRFIHQFISQFKHSSHLIDLFSSFPQIWPFTFYHLIKEAKIGSEVVGADEENILSRSSSNGQKLEEKKQWKSNFLQHLKYSNLFTDCHRWQRPKVGGWRRRREARQKYFSLSTSEIFKPWHEWHECDIFVTDCHRVWGGSSGCRRREARKE